MIPLAATVRRRGRGSGLRVDRRRTRLMGLTGLGIFPPRSVEGVEQKFIVEVPTLCEKCGSAALSLNREAGQLGPIRRVTCFACGWDAFLVLPALMRVAAPVQAEVGQARVTVMTGSVVMLDPVPVTTTTGKRKRRRIVRVPGEPIRTPRRARRANLALP